MITLRADMDFNLNFRILPGDRSGMNANWRGHCQKGRSGATAQMAISAADLAANQTTARRSRSFRHSSSAAAASTPGNTTWLTAAQPKFASN